MRQPQPLSTTTSRFSCYAWLVHRFSRWGGLRRRRVHAADVPCAYPDPALLVCKQPHAAAQDVAVLQLHLAGPQGCDSDACGSHASVHSFPPHILQRSPVGSRHFPAVQYPHSGASVHMGMGSCGGQGHIVWGSTLKRWAAGVALLRTVGMGGLGAPLCGV